MLSRERWVCKGGGDEVEAVGFEAGDGEGLVGKGGEVEGEGDGGDKVDVGDVGVEL